jgi:hypothetical protein
MKRSEHYAKEEARLIANGDRAGIRWRKRPLIAWFNFRRHIAFIKFIRAYAECDARDALTVARFLMRTTMQIRPIRTD